MPRRASLAFFALPLVVLFACSELRVADQAGDAGPATEQPGDEDAGGEVTGDGSTAAPKDAGAKDGSSPPKDSGAQDSAPPPPVCDGPCPPDELASNLTQATALTVDATNIYFAVEGGSGNGTVYQCPKTGCVGSPIVLGEGYAMGIVVANGTVYWGDFSAGKLVSCAVGGCNDAPTAVVSNQTSIHGVFTDGVDLFWETAGTIRHCPQATCSDATAKDIATGQGFVTRLAADQGKVIWPNNGKMWECPAATCPTPTELGPGAVDPSIHAGVAYWGTSAKNVVGCAIGGCNKSPITIGASPFSPRFPVSDGTNVYWRDELYDQIYRCPATGCLPGPETIAYDQHMQPGGQIALDGVYVYWTNSDGVYRLKK